MCGIIGYVGKYNAVPILIEGLKRLEYRGYDSSGIGLVDTKTSQLMICRAEGKIVNLEKQIASRKMFESCIGISHTRWATHGMPTESNAHPQYSKGIAVVHNGIIENYSVLREELREEGFVFESETDTEVIVHLIHKYYEGNLRRAVMQMLKDLEGSFALGIISACEPETLIATQVSSPLVIGLGLGENFIASDVPAILDKTRKFIYLNDGEVAEITKDRVDVFMANGKPVKPEIHSVTFNVDKIKKQGYEHFMLKEIHDQEEVLSSMIKRVICKENIVLEGLKISDSQLRCFKHIIILACGTAYHAGMVGKYVIEKLVRIPVSIEAASEFRYSDPIVDNNTLVIAISQSGETADTLAAVKEAKLRGAKVVAICNVVGSSLVREVDATLYTYAGLEISVASTKAYTAQLTMLYFLAFKLANVFDKDLGGLVGEIQRIPSMYQSLLENKSGIEVIAKENSHFGCFLFLGRNVNFPSALEGSLKLKEISYIPAEGYPAGEMKHGPIALIDEYRAVICIAPQTETYGKMVSNIQEIRVRKGNIIAIVTEGDEVIKEYVRHTIVVPKIMDILTPLVVALPLQLFAYYVAVQLGCDVDQPRNLAKAVTVE